jgi:enoyl-CoA hydratase/carnithine racemase
MLAEIGQHQVGRNRRDLIEPHLAPLALAIVFPGLGEAALKRLVHQAKRVSFDEQLEAERDAFVAAAGTKDFREGVAAFFERRRAKFGDQAASKIEDR